MEKTMQYLVDPHIRVSVFGYFTFILENRSIVW